MHAKIIILLMLLIFLLPGISAINYQKAITNDTWVRQSSPTTNYGADTDWAAQNAATDNRRFYVAVDLSRNSSITWDAANLSFRRLYVNNTASYRLLLYYCNDVFLESTLTWNNQGTEVINCDATPFYNQTLATVYAMGVRPQFNITSKLNNDADKRFTVKGKLDIEGNSKVASAGFYSNENGNSQYIPNVSLTLNFLALNNISYYPASPTPDDDIQLFCNGTDPASGTITYIYDVFSIVNNIATNITHGVSKRVPSGSGFYIYNLSAASTDPYKAYRFYCRVNTSTQKTAYQTVTTNRLLPSGYATNKSTADNYITDAVGYRDTVYGTGPLNYVRSLQSFARYSFFEFKLNNSGMNTSYAEFSFYVNYSTGSSSSYNIISYYCDDTYNEATLTWNNAGTEVVNCNSKPIANVTYGTYTTGNRYYLNLTKLVNDDLDKKFAIKMTPYRDDSVTTYEINIPTKEHPTSSLRPYMGFVLYSSVLTTNASISPTSPYTNDTLEGYCKGTYTDNVSFIYTFYKNDINISSGITTKNYTSGTNVNVANVSAASTTAGDQWKIICRAFSGSNYASPLTSSTVSILNAHPIIRYVTVTSPITLLSGANKSVYTVFNVSDIDGGISSNVIIKYTRGITVISNLSCIIITNTSTWWKFNCTSLFPYYTPAGSYDINVSVTDNAGNARNDTSYTSTVDTLDSININVSTINFGTSSPGINDVSGSVIKISNYGNKNYSTITIKAQELNYSTNVIPATSFCSNDIDDANNGCNALINNTDVTVTGMSIVAGLKTHDLMYNFLDIPIMIAQGTYMSRNPWTITTS